MASVHQVKKSPYWWGAFRNSEGRRFFRSTGMLEKGKALEVARAWEKALHSPVESPEQARRVLREILEPVLGKGGGSVSCEAYVERWIEERRAVVAGSTLAFYEGTLAAWLRWLGPRASASLESVSREEVVRWRNEEARRVRSRTTNHRLRALRRLLADALREGFVRANAAEGVESVRTTPAERTAGRVRRPFTLPELRRLEQVCGEEWALILWLGFFTGQRLGDVLRLRWEQISEENRAVQLTAQKTKKRMWIPLPSGLLGRLKNWRAVTPGEALFPEQVCTLEATGGRVGGASKAFAHLLFLAGLRSHSPFGAGLRKAKADEEGEGNRRAPQELSFHSLRHTARTLLEEAGLPKAVVDAFVGHAGDSGKIYTTVGEAALRLAGAALEKAAG